MKNFIIAFALFLLLAGCEKTETIADIVVSESQYAVTVKLENQTFDEGTNNNYYYSTFSISNNSNKQLDSVKVDIIVNPQLQQQHNRYTFKPVLPYEKNFITIFHTTTSQLKTTLEWW